MKKNFLIYLTKALFLSFILSFVSCNDYDDDIDNLTNEINSLKSLLGSSTDKLVANVSVNGSIITISYTDGSSDILDTKGDIEEYNLEIVDGVLQLVTDGSGSKSVTLPEYTIQLEENQLVLLKDGVPAGQVTLPETNDSGSGSIIELPTAADFTVENGYLCYKGDPTEVYLGSGTTELKIVAENGKYFIYQDGVAIDGFIPIVELVDGKLIVMGEGLDIDALLPENASVVIYQLDDEDNVVSVNIQVGDETITLPIARPLEGLIFIPDLYVDGIGTVKYNILKIDEEVKIRSISTLKFRTNPSTADISGLNWVFLNRAVEFGTRAEEAEESDELIKITGKVEQNLSPYSSISIPTKGIFENSKADTINNIYDVVNLKAAGGSSSTLTGDVVSNDFQVLFYTYNNVEITNKQDAETSIEANHYVFPDSEENYTECDPQFTIDVKGDQTFDLVDYVSAVLDQNNLYSYESYGEVSSDEYDFVELDTLGFIDYTWEFKSISFIPDNSNNTDQSYYVELAGSKVTVKGNTAYEDRTPVFEVNLLDENGEVIVTRYIKFLLKKGDSTEPITEYIIKLGNIDYKSLYDEDPTISPLDWTEVSDMIYEGLGISHNQFVEYYITNGDSIELTYEGYTVATNYYKYTEPLEDLGEVTLVEGTQDTGTTLLKITIDPQTGFGNHEWIAVLSSSSTSTKINLKITFTLIAPTHPSLSDSYVNADGVATVTGQIDDSGVFSFSAVMSEVLNTSDWERFSDEGYENATHTMSFNDYTIDGDSSITASLLGIAIGESNESGTISEEDYSTQEITTNKIDVAERRYNVAFLSLFENHGLLETSWVYRFVNPLKVTLDSSNLELKTSLDPDRINVYESLTITVLNDIICENGEINDANCEKYGIDIEELSWGIEYNESEVAVVGKLDLDEEGIGTDEEGNLGYFLIWNNQGNSLLIDNKDAELVVTVETDYAIAEERAVITLLATETEEE